MDENDAGLMYWQQLGLQQKFESIFNDEVKDERTRDTKEAISPKRNIMEGWSDERKEEWRQGK